MSRTGMVDDGPEENGPQCNADSNEATTGMIDPIQNQVNEGTQLLACQYLREQLDVLAQHTQGVRLARDIEDVHQARVASRRIRAALAMFKPCFPGKKVKQWTRCIRGITAGLGLARDKDVQILFARDMLQHLSEDNRRYRTGIQRLHLRLSQQRSALQPRLVKLLDKLDRSQVLGDMAGDLERMLFALRSRQISVETPMVRAETAGQIQSRLAAFLASQDCLADATRVDEHHRMRILAKKLRYTLEICRAAYGRDLSEPIKSVKRVQTLLGDVHDCDVWAEQIDHFIRDEYQRTLEYFGHNRPFNFIQPGLDYLKQERLIQRQNLFGELQQTWNQIDQEGAWESLTALLQQVCTPPVVPQQTDISEVYDKEDDEANLGADRPDRGYPR